MRWTWDFKEEDTHEQEYHTLELPKDTAIEAAQDSQKGIVRHAESASDCAVADLVHQNYTIRLALHPIGPRQVYRTLSTSSSSFIQ